MRLDFTEACGGVTGAHSGAPLRCELMMVELSGNSLGLGELMMVEYPRRDGPLCPPGVLSLE
jgi:hypothetical protein